MAVFDPVRGRYVADGPEERVRQRVLQILVENHQVPMHLIETEFPLGRLQARNRERVDIVVHDFRSGGRVECPWLLLECKRAEVSEQELSDQLNRYLKVLQPRYLAVVEGDAWRIFSWDPNGGFTPCAALPTYPAIQL